MDISSLLEIIEPEINPTKQYKGTFKSSRNPNAKNQVGQPGLFSRATVNKKDPHTIKKYTRNFSAIGNKDAFHAYADYIYQNKLWENPYFPRIYKKDTIEDRKGQTLKKYEIEKLISVETLSSKELFSIFENVFGVDKETAIDVLKVQMKAEGLKPSNKEHVKMAMGNLLAKVIDQGVREGIGMERIKDDNLKQAIQHIQRVKKNEKLELDVNRHNIMARRTPYGAQLVFTDPFSRKR